MEASSGRLSAARVVAGLLFLAIGFANIHLLVGGIWPHGFFDARVFVRTIDQIRAGHDPYDLIYGRNPDLNHLPFVYPPLIGWLLEGIAKTTLPRQVVENVIFGLVVGGIAAGIASSLRLFFEFKAPLVILGVGVFAAFLNGSGMMAVHSGNISSLFWGLALGTSLLGFGKCRWRYFHAAIFAATLCKPYFAALWIIPVLASGWSWRQFRIGAATAAGAAAIYGGVAVIKPELTTAWLAALASRAQVADVGSGLYGLLHWRLGSAVALAVQAIYILVLVGMLHFGESRGRLRYAALIIIAIAANPRLMLYDYAFAAIPAFYIYTTRLEQLFGSRCSAWLNVLVGLAVAILSCEMFREFPPWHKIWLVFFLGGAVLLAARWKPFETKPPNLA
jgi:hypothetical protein